MELETSPHNTPSKAIKPPGVAEAWAFLHEVKNALRTSDADKYMQFIEMLTPPFTKTLNDILDDIILLFGPNNLHLIEGLNIFLPPAHRLICSDGYARRAEPPSIEQTPAPDGDDSESGEGNEPPFADDDAVEEDTETASTAPRPPLRRSARRTTNKYSSAAP